MKRNWIFFTVLAVVLFSLSNKKEHISAFANERYSELQLFAKVLNLVQQYYIEEKDTKKLIYGGIKGILNELDPHTNFLPPETFKEFEAETSGEFGGLGIEITVKDEVLTIISPIEDTPAAKAGLQAGDRIVSINGESTKGLNLVEAAQRMRGDMGSSVTLGIMREGLSESKDYVIHRGRVKVRSVRFSDLEDGYAYVRLTTFIENTARDLERVLRSHEKKNGGIRGLILDLRRNPGGLLEQAVRISDMFLEEGVIVSTKGRNKMEQEVRHARGPANFAGFPIVVLIDEYSASASEILAGALQDNKRALVMGQRSFGKGSVQSVVKLGDGSGLKLTVARYYTPNGRSIQAEGIAPDVEVAAVNMAALERAKSRGPVRREQDVVGHLQGEPQVSGKESPLRRNWWRGRERESTPLPLSEREKLLQEDYQLTQAFNYLKAFQVMNN